MPGITLEPIDSSTIDTPLTGITIFEDALDGIPKYLDHVGFLHQFGALESFNGRTGAVVPLVGDYAAFYDAIGAAAAAQAASQPLDSDLTVLAGITIAANTFPARSSSGAAAAKVITDFGLSLVDDANASTARTTLGLGSASLNNTADFDAAGAAAAAQAASQPLDSDLTLLAGITVAANQFLARASTGALAGKVITDFGLSLVDDVDAAAARTTLGLGTAATTASTAYDVAGAAAAAQAASQPLDSDLTLLAGITVAANQFLARASTGALAGKVITDFGLSLVDDVDAAAARTTLGLGTAATTASTAYDAAGAAAAAQAASQPLDSDLTILAGITLAANQFIGRSSSGAATNKSITDAGFAWLAAADAAAETALLNFGTAAGTACQGNDSRFPPSLSNSRGQNTFFPAAASAGGSLLLVSGTVYCCYVGQVTNPSGVVIAQVRLGVGVIGAGTQAAEVGVYTSPLPPNGAGQTLTKVDAKSLGAVLTSLGDKTNTVAMTLSAAFGAHVWLCFRQVMSITQASSTPNVVGDFGTGNVLSNTAGVGALTSLASFAAALIADGFSGGAAPPICPFLVGTTF